MNRSFHAWPRARVQEAVAQLLSQSGLAALPTSLTPGFRLKSGASGGDLIEWQARSSGCIADPVELGLGDLEKHLCGLCPLLVEIGEEAEESYVAVLRFSRNAATVIAPNGECAVIGADVIYQALRQPSQSALAVNLLTMLSVTGVAGSEEQRGAIVNQMLRTENADQGCRVGWSFTSRERTGWRGLLASAGIVRNGACLMLAHVVQYVLWLASWTILGRVSLRGQMDPAWLVAWALLLLTLIPLRVFGTYAQGVIAVAVGAALKRRLLLGAMRIDPQQARLQGIGKILSQVFESEAAENLALSGGISGVLAVFELIVAAIILGPLSLLLLGTIVLAAAVLVLFSQRYERWTGARMSMSEHLVESMVGHRTRVAQQKSDDWHRDEDEMLRAYHVHSKRTDWTGAWLISAMPRLWLLASLALLAPQALSGLQEQSTLALRLGGVLLAFTALQRFTGAAVDIAGTIVAGRRVAPLLRAADCPPAAGRVPPETAERTERGKVMEAEKLEFRYHSGSKLALHPATLTIRHGERLLLQGASGGGKSTISALMAGTRAPSAGLLLAGGLDRFTLGEAGWRKRVAAAPQFQENHILTETLAFNLLLGRSWPPRRKDLEEAEALCIELGLGPLLERMPSGLMQMVGEGGWQLSHGERSRVFLARALLQQASLTILDESFGALDPETAQTALQCALARTDALVVIAHP